MGLDMKLLLASSYDNSESINPALLARALRVLTLRTEGRIPQCGPMKL